MKFIDMHIHLDDYEASELSNDTIYIHNSMDSNSYNKCLKKFGIMDNVVITPGLHPASYLESWDYSIKSIESTPFIGEVGLDYFWIEDRDSYQLQLDNFRTSLKAAIEYERVPMIHTKGAEKEVLQELKKNKIEKFLIHWYSGPVDLINNFLKLGGYFTLGPDIFTDSLIYKYIPIERVFLETDNPTGSPWILGRTATIKELYDHYSKLMKIPLNELQKTIMKNYKRIKL